MTYPSQPGQPPEYQSPARMPSKVRWAVAGLWVQGVLNALGGLLLLAVAADRSDHGQSGAGTLRALGLFSLIIAVVLIGCAICAVKRFSWVKPTALVLQGIAIIGGVVSLFSGAFQALLGIAIAVAIIQALRSEESAEWFVR